MQPPQIFLHDQREFHCNKLHIQQFSWKQHIFAMRDKSLLLGINFHRQKLIQASVSSNKSFKFDFLKFWCIFPCGMVVLTFFYDNIVIQLVLCVTIVFIERQRRIFIQKCWEIFLWRETALSAHRMKSHEKLFFCQNYVFFLFCFVFILLCGCVCVFFFFFFACCFL